MHNEWHQERYVGPVGELYSIDRLGCCGSLGGWERATMQIVRGEERTRNPRNVSGWTKWRFFERAVVMSVERIGTWTHTDY